MATNGKLRRPASPLRIVAPGASVDEAAAIAAAIEQFVADTQAPPASSRPDNPWQRAALLEGVARAESVGPGRRPY